MATTGASNARVEQLRVSHRPSVTRHLPQSATFEQIGNAVVCGALDDLLGVGRWQRPEGWGLLLVTFPESAGRWEVPTANWHLDFPASHSSSGLAAVRIFTCLAKLSPRAGGTLFVAGSHRLVQSLVREGERLASSEVRRRLIRTHRWLKELGSWGETENRVQKFMNRGTTIEGIEVRVVEMTGAPGDVVLVHPMMLHAPAINCSTAPRFASSATVFGSGASCARLSAHMSLEV